MLCSAPSCCQHPRTIPHFVISSHRQHHRLVARQTSTTCLCSSCTLGDEPKPCKIFAGFPSPVVPSHDRTPCPMPCTVLQDDLHQACLRGGHSLQPQISHRILVNGRTSTVLLPNMVPVQVCCPQPHFRSLGPVRIPAHEFSSSWCCCPCWRFSSK